MQKVFALILLAAVAAQAKYIPELVDRIALYPDILRKLGLDEVVKSSGRVVGGTEATPHEFPWQVAITIDGASFCGGSLISETNVLTAAHCTDGARAFSVLLGAHDRTVAEPSQVTVRSTVAKTHEGWDRATVANDVAVIVLPSPVALTAEIQPICLVPATTTSDSVGNIVTVSGWGKTEDGLLQGVSPTLNKVDAPIITTAQCAAVFGDIITESIVCIDTAGGKGSCNGDSGGPLMYTRNGVKEQIGIVSFGTRSCEGGNPAGFTRVSKYTQWLTDNASGYTTCPSV